jgi:hypothetical protein
MDKAAHERGATWCGVRPGRVRTAAKRWRRVSPLGGWSGATATWRAVHTQATRARAPSTPRQEDRRRPLHARRGAAHTSVHSVSAPSRPHPRRRFPPGSRPIRRAPAGSRPTRGAAALPAGAGPSSRPLRPRACRFAPSGRRLAPRGAHRRWARGRDLSGRMVALAPWGRRPRSERWRPGLRRQAAPSPGRWWCSQCRRRAR